MFDVPTVTLSLHEEEEEEEERSWRAGCCRAQVEEVLKPWGVEMRILTGKNNRKTNRKTKGKQGTVLGVKDLK